MRRRGGLEVSGESGAFSVSRRGRQIGKSSIHEGAGKINSTDESVQRNITQTIKFYISLKLAEINSHVGFDLHGCVREFVVLLHGLHGWVGGKSKFPDG